MVSVSVSGQTETQRKDPSEKRALEHLVMKMQKDDALLPISLLLVDIVLKLIPKEKEIEVANYF